MISLLPTMKTDAFDPLPLADAVRLTRERSKLTQQELAVKTGFHPAAISHFETGHRTPTIPNIIRLCRAMKTTPNEILAIYLLP